MEQIDQGHISLLAPEKVKAVDTNGAGDTFATAYMLAVATHSPNPGAVVNWAASRAVQQPQSCKPDCIEASIRAESRWAQVSAWFRGQGQRCADCIQQALNSTAAQSALQWAAQKSQQALLSCRAAWQHVRPPH